MSQFWGFSSGAKEGFQEGFGKRGVRVGWGERKGCNSGAFLEGLGEIEGPGVKGVRKGPGCEGL